MKKYLKQKLRKECENLTKEQLIEKVVEETERHSLYVRAFMLACKNMSATASELMTDINKGWQSYYFLFEEYYLDRAKREEGGFNKETGGE